MRKFTLASLFIALFLQSNAQLDVINFMNLGRNGIKDIETLAGAYLEQFGTGLATSLASGWFNTARPNHLFGFDFSVGVTMTTIPNEAKTFSLADYDWNVLSYDQYANPTSPTVAGHQNTLADIGIDYQDENGTQIKLDNLFKMPQGANLGFVPMPIVHLGVGLYKGTDIQLRLLPPMPLSDFGSISMFGVGVKHDFKQWIPVVKKLPFDAAIAINYSKVNSVFSEIEYFPTDFMDIDIANMSQQMIRVSQSPNDIEALYYSKQELQLHMSSFSANLILSKKLLFLTLYGSLGFSNSQSQIQLVGPYVLPNMAIVGTSTVVELDEANTVTDPIDIKTGYKSFRSGIGARIKLAVLTLHGEVTYQDYTMYNVGIGVALR